MVEMVQYLDITFISSQIVFGTQRFIQFISRTPTLKALEKVRVTFEDGAARVNLSSGYGELSVKVLCGNLGRQLSSLEHVFNSSLPPFSTLEDLYIYESVYWRTDGQDIVENNHWLELLRPFTAAKNLYLSEEIASCIVPALEELVGGRTTEVLPALRNIFLEGLQPSEPIQEGIGQFVASRQVTNHPIAITCWIRTSEGYDDDDDDDEEDND